MAGLLNEDYVAFLDESGETGLQVVAGVLIPSRWLRSAEHRWRDFIRDHLGSRSGRTEVKGRELTKGQGASLHAQQKALVSGAASLTARAAGHLFYHDALEHIARTREVCVLTVALPTDRPVEVYRLWFWMMYALLVERSHAPRPRLPLTFIDGEDVSFRAAHDLIAFRFYRTFPRIQPYVQRGDEWFVGGSAHQDSQLHPFIQTADLVAGAARHAIAQRPRFKDWYGTYLRNGSWRGPQIDVSDHALQRLQQLSPQDTCGSGWPNALLVPP